MKFQVLLVICNHLSSQPPSRS